MNSTLLYVLMVFGSLILAAMPFGVFMGLGSVLGIEEVDFRLKFAFFLVAVVMSFGISFGAFALLQKSNCGEVKNWKQVSLNSLLSAGFQAGILVLIAVVPWFRTVVSNLLPPDVDAVVKETVGYSYYSFWAMLFGMAIGGTMSSSCAVAVDKQTDWLDAVPQEKVAPAANATANAEEASAELPPE
jgi:hypothetical protein